MTRMSHFCWHQASKEHVERKLSFFLIGQDRDSAEMFSELLQWPSVLPTEMTALSCSLIPAAPASEPGLHVCILRAHTGTHLLSCNLQALIPLLLLCIHIQSGHDIYSHQLGMETTINSLCRQGFLPASRQASAHPGLFFTHTQSLPFYGMGVQIQCDPSGMQKPWLMGTYRLLTCGHIQAKAPWERPQGSAQILTSLPGLWDIPNTYRIYLSLVL